MLQCISYVTPSISSLVNTNRFPWAALSYQACSLALPNIVLTVRYLWNLVLHYMCVVHALYMNPAIVGTTMRSILYKEVSLIQGLINNMICVSPTLCPPQRVLIIISECPHREVPLYVCVSWSQCSTNLHTLQLSMPCCHYTDTPYQDSVVLYSCTGTWREVHFPHWNFSMGKFWIGYQIHVDYMLPRVYNLDVTVSGTCSVYGIGTLVSCSQPHSPWWIVWCHCPLAWRWYQTTWWRVGTIAVRGTREMICTLSNEIHAT